VAWCLVTQEALLYAPWTGMLPKLDCFKEATGPGGEPLFRGPRYHARGSGLGSFDRGALDHIALQSITLNVPNGPSLFLSNPLPSRRLKMGICEGYPKSILPDHVGRADYFGASVNQAARYMDAGKGPLGKMNYTGRGNRGMTCTIGAVGSSLCFYTTSKQATEIQGMRSDVCRLSKRRPSPLIQAPMVARSSARRLWL
jgi:hypothetical protein